jgi:hypothetical protein
MAWPLIVGAVAAAALAAKIIQRSQAKHKVAESVNRMTDAQAAALGRTATRVEESNLLQSLDGVFTFVKVSPPGRLMQDSTHGVGEPDVDSAFIPGDMLTIDTVKAGATSLLIPSGNMLVKVAGTASLGTIPVTSADPRTADHFTVFSVPTAAITDAMSVDTSPEIRANIIIGMRQ